MKCTLYVITTLSRYNNITLIIIAYTVYIGEGINLDGSYNTRYRETVPVHMSGVQCSGTESRLVYRVSS